MTVWETVERGEYVMIALAVLVPVIVCIWWIRSVRLAKEKKSCPHLMHRVRDYIIEGDLENARKICELRDFSGAAVIGAGLRYVGHPMAEVNSKMEGEARIQKQKMSKALTWLKSLAVISPLLGLGGSLVGVIDRLRDIGESEIPADTSLLAAEIAPTIVTTVAGLVTGIIAILAFTCLESSIHSARLAIDKAAMELTDILNQPS